MLSTLPVSSRFKNLRALVNLLTHVILSTKGALSQLSLKFLSSSKKQGLTDKNALLYLESLLKSIDYTFQGPLNTKLIPKKFDDTFLKFLISQQNSISYILNLANNWWNKYCLKMTDAIIDSENLVVDLDLMKNNLNFRHYQNYIIDYENIIDGIIKFGRFIGTKFDSKDETYFKNMKNDRLNEARLFYSILDNCVKSIVMSKHKLSSDNSSNSSNNGSNVDSLFLVLKSNENIGVINSVIKDFKEGIESFSKVLNKESDSDESKVEELNCDEMIGNCNVLLEFLSNDLSKFIEWYEFIINDLDFKVNVSVDIYKQNIMKKRKEKVKKLREEREKNKKNNQNNEKNSKNSENNSNSINSSNSNDLSVVLSNFDNFDDEYYNDDYYDDIINRSIELSDELQESVDLLRHYKKILTNISSMKKSIRDICFVVFELIKIHKNINSTNETNNKNNNLQLVESKTNETDAIIVKNINWYNEYEKYLVSLKENEQKEDKKDKESNNDNNNENNGEDILKTLDNMNFSSDDSDNDNLNTGSLDDIIPETKDSEGNTLVSVIAASESDDKNPFYCIFRDSILTLTNPSTSPMRSYNVIEIQYLLISSNVLDYWFNNRTIINNNSSDSFNKNICKRNILIPLDICSVISDYISYKNMSSFPSKVKAYIFDFVVLYLDHHQNDYPPEIAKPIRSVKMDRLVSDKWDAKFVNLMPKKIVFEVILAANYLSIDSLLHLGCAKIATLIKGKSPDEIKQILAEE